MQDKRVPHNMQLAAAKDLLDRAGLAAGHEITLNIPAYLQDIEGLFIDVKSDIVDAELVDEGDLLQIVDRSDINQPLSPLFLPLPQRSGSAVPRPTEPLSLSQSVQLAGMTLLQCADDPEALGEVPGGRLHS